MKIDETVTPSGAEVYYSDSFRAVIEDHMTFLRTHPQTYRKSVTSAQAYKFEGDFFGLLQEINEPSQFHWIILRMNKLTSPVYSTDDITSILVPSGDVVERLRSVYMNINKIRN